MEPVMMSKIQSRLLPAEQETEAKAKTIIAQIESARLAIQSGTRDDGEELNAWADRIERAVRDFTVALRELARTRRRDESS
jgi:hypothetical protein